MATIRGDARVMLLMLRGFRQEARLPGALASRLPILEMSSTSAAGRQAVAGAGPIRAPGGRGRQAGGGKRDLLATKNSKGRSAAGSSGHG